MKRGVDFITAIFLLLFHINSQAQKTYEIISKKTGRINTRLAARLPVNLKAMAAFYSAMGGTDCLELECALTTALGLGKQGSDAHKALIKKYFPNDNAAKLVIGQDCYQPPSSSSAFSNFRSLALYVNLDTVKVNYQLTVFERGSTKIIKGPDIYLFRNNVFINIKRVMYAWTTK
jgi:hypothetical protein